MIRRSILFNMTFLFIVNSFAQKVVVSTVNSTIAYAGLSAPLNIVVEGYKCSDIYVSTDNGKIDGKGCDYNLYPTKIGQAKITVKVKKDGRLKRIGETIFRVKEIPEPHFKIGSGKIAMPIVELASQQYARLEDSDGACWDICNYKIDSFKISIVSNKILSREVVNIGNKLDSTIFKGLQPEDLILIRDISVTAGNGIQKILADLILRVY